MTPDSQLVDARFRGVIVTLGVIAVLFLAKSVFIPIALAIFLSFVLSPLVSVVERLRIGRIAAVICVLAFCSVALTLLMWVLGTQLNEVSRNLNQYQDNIVRRVEDLRSLTPAGFDQAQTAMAEIEKQVLETTVEPAKADSKVEESISEKSGENEESKESDASEDHSADDTQPVQVAVVADHTNPVGTFLGFVNPVLAPIATFGIVILITVFILLDNQDFRDRLVQLFGSTNIAVVSTAVNDASDRSMTWLRTMFLINTIYGVAVAGALYAFGLPSALLWGFLAFVCRFVPYVGPWVGALIPILLSLAVFEGWVQPLGIVTMYIVYELAVNMIVEPVFYGRSLGLTSIGIVLAAIFWTWLWGPAGLLIAVPVTLWLVVLGRYIPQMSQFTVLFSEHSDLPSFQYLYQALLAQDEEKGETHLRQHFENGSASDVLGQLIAPLLQRMALDRRAEYLSDEHFHRAQRTLVSLVKEITEDLNHNSENSPDSELADDGGSVPEKMLCRVLLASTGSEPANIIAAILRYELIKRFQLECNISDTSQSVDMLAKMLACDPNDVLIICSDNGAEEIAELNTLLEQRDAAAGPGLVGVLVCLSDSFQNANFLPGLLAGTCRLESIDDAIATIEEVGFQSKTPVVNRTSDDSGLGPMADPMLARK